MVGSRGGIDASDPDGATSFFGSSLQDSWETIGAVEADDKARAWASTRTSERVLVVLALKLTEDGGVALVTVSLTPDRAIWY